MKKFKKETIAAKAGIGSDMHHGSIVPPLYLSSNFEYKELGKEQEYEYLKKIFDSKNEGFNHQIKIFEIDYEKFDFINSK